MHTDTTIITKLRQLAGEVRNYQLERGWSDSKLCKEIASVGSSKTYKRILDGEDDLDDLSHDNWLKNYQSAVEIIASLRTKDRPAEPEYSDFTAIQRAEIAVRRAMQEDEECVARLVIIEGQTSTGKDAVRRHLLNKFLNNTVAVEANDLWKNSPTPGHTALYHALKIVRQGENQKPPRTPSELLAEIIGYLNERKLILIINEAHHLGIPGLNMVKTILNATPTIVVLECIPVLLTRLLGSNYEEAIQLTGNRLCERVYLPTPPGDEILLMLDRRGVKFENVEVKNSCAKMLEADAPTYGNWRFVIQITRKLYEAGKRAPVSQSVVAKAVSEVKAMRTRIIKES
jgi:hypothetical protein